MDDLRARRGKFLSAACSKLGYCIPPTEVERLIDEKPMAADDFLLALYKAEGIEPVHLRSYPGFKELLALYVKHVGEGP